MECSWTNPSAPRRKEAFAAIKAMGPKAVPHLLSWLHDRQPRGVDKILFQLAEKSAPIVGYFWNDRLKVEPDRAENAQKALELLGPAAETAIPQLTRTLMDGKEDAGEGEAMRRTAGHVLASLGSAGLPPLIGGLTNRNSTVRRAAAESFEWLTTNKEEAIPHLIRALKDPDCWVGFYNRPQALVRT